MDNNTIKNQEKESGERSGEQNGKRYLPKIIVGILIITVVITALMTVLYITDRPKLTIDEDMLGTDEDAGKVLYIYAGDAPTPPITVDYTVKSYFSKPIGNVKYLVTGIGIVFGSAPKNYMPHKILEFHSTPEFQTKEFNGQLYVHASNSLKLQKGETRFVTMKIYADWLDYRPKGSEEATSYWTSEPIETVTVKLYG